MKAPGTEAQMIGRLSSSPYVLAVADSILKNIDRETLADLVACYLYLGSKGKASLGSLVAYAVSRRFREIAAIAASATPALLVGILVDEEFRSVILSSVGYLIRKLQSGPKRP